MYRIATCALVGLAPGTVLYFTDNGWTGTGFRGVSATDSDGNETLMKYTVGANGLAAGTTANWDPAGVALDSAWGPRSEAFDDLAGDVLELIYSGNAKQAWTLIRQSCPIDRPR